MKIAVLLATYNNEKYLSQMLSSLLNQSFRDFVCYIRDDGSADRTVEIARDYEKNHPDMFRVVYDGFGDRLGAKGNFFSLLKSVEADVYFFADADDVWSKDKIKKSILRLDGMESGDKPLCVFTDMYVTDEKLNIIHDSFIRFLDRDPQYFRYQEIIMDNPAAGCTICFNRACRDAAVFADSADGDGLFSTVVSQVEMHDVWVLITAALLGEVDVIDEPLVHYRQHGDNEMGARSESVLQKLTRNIAGFFDGTLKAKKAAYYNNAKNLARSALLLHGLSPKDREVLSGFCDMDKLSKPKRIAFLRDSGFRRKKHSLWIWLWA